MTKADLLNLAARVEAARNLMGIAHRATCRLAVAEGEHGEMSMALKWGDLHHIAAALRAMAEEAPDGR